MPIFISQMAYENSRHPALKQIPASAYYDGMLKQQDELTLSGADASPSMGSERLRVFVHGLLFVVGFSMVFIVGWGGSVTLAGQLFGTYKEVIARTGGVIVIMFGLSTLGLIRIPWFHADTRSHYMGRAGTFANSGLMGILFAAGWSPCIGATLGAILTMGLSQQTVGQAMWLASGYSMGLGIPFLVMALGLDRATDWVKRMSRYRRLIQIASGSFIILIGLLLLTNTMSRIAIWAFQNGLYVERFALFSAAPTYLTAILAGLLSFLSPCVLPLVPAYLGYLSGHSLEKAQATR